jgi:protease I
MVNLNGIIMNESKINARSVEHDSADELALDDANEMSFPASDPIASSNIAQIEIAPEMSFAAADHQNSAAMHENMLDYENRDQIHAQEASELTAIGLKQMKIAILVTDGFEQSELLVPRKALEAVGVKVEVISDKIGSVQGFEHTKKGASVNVDKSFDDACSDDYAAVLLPGGVVNGDAMRMLPQARKFVQEANRMNKPIASICHGGWLLISAGIANQRSVTSWPSLQDDFRNAGAAWLDKEVVCDENFVSSRKPTDIPAFSKAFISLLREQQVLG